jgi:hypothetical protein
MVPSMHPAFSAPRHAFPIKRLCYRIEVWPTNFPCPLVMRGWIVGLLYTSGGSSTLKVTSDLALPLCAMPYA